MNRNVKDKYFHEASDDNNPPIRAGIGLQKVGEGFQYFQPSTTTIELCQWHAFRD